MTKLKNGALLLTLMSLISGCATRPPETIIVDPPNVAFPSEISLLDYPIRPEGELKTNCHMHNYRKKLEEFGCDSVFLFSSFVERMTGKKQVTVPTQCTEILKGTRNYLNCNDID